MTGSFRIRTGFPFPLRDYTALFNFFQYGTISSFCQVGRDAGTGLFHEASKTLFLCKPAIDPVEIPSDKRFPRLSSLSATPSPVKKAQNIPSFPIYTFFKCCIFKMSIKTSYSAEDILLSQRRVIAEIIHGFCHNSRTVARQYGYPQDVISELPDQSQIVL